jgi:predicted amidophosphoribosyltransferase
MEIPRHWRLKAQRYRLEGSICPNCGQRIFPPRPVCPHCTIQLTRITGWVFPASVNTIQIESRIRYEIKERIIG